MPEIVDYFILDSNSLQGLINDVKQHMREGWQPLGGVCSTNNDADLLYSQAIVIYKK
jgi:hypothetical protein